MHKKRKHIISTLKCCHIILERICIYRNKGGIGVENLSSILKRNDIKKSEVYDSGYLGGTVPEYEAYMALKKVFEKRI